MAWVTNDDCIELRGIIRKDFGPETEKSLTDEDIRMFGEFLLACAGVKLL